MRVFLPPVGSEQIIRLLRNAARLDANVLPKCQDARFRSAGARLLRSASIISMAFAPERAPSSLALAFLDGLSAFFFSAMISSNAS